MKPKPANPLTPYPGLPVLSPTERKELYHNGHVLCCFCITVSYVDLCLKIWNKNDREHGLNWKMLGQYVENGYMHVIVCYKNKKGNENV
jgi:hypothetical protein